MPPKADSFFSLKIDPLIIPPNHPPTLRKTVVNKTPCDKPLVKKAIVATKSKGKEIFTPQKI
jgi:hypothetical protein